MNEFESTLQPLVLDVLDLVRRTQAIAQAGGAGVDPAAVVQANQLIRAALGMLPELEYVDELEEVAPALPSAPSFGAQAGEEPAEAPTEGWLLDGAGDAGFLDQG